MIDEIEDHRKNSDAVKKENGTIINPSGLQKKEVLRGMEGGFRGPVPLADYAVR